MFVGCFVRFYCPKPNQQMRQLRHLQPSPPFAPFPDQAGAPKTMQHNARKLRNQITNNNSNRGYPARTFPLPQVELRQSIIMLACNRNNCSPQGGDLEGEGGCHWGLTLQKSLLEPGLSLVVAVVVSLSTGQPFGVKDERVTTTGGG